MKHLWAILLKFVLVAVILEIYMLLATNLNFGQVIVLSLVITILSYVIGDLLVLPHSNNIAATIVDLVLTLITIYIFRFIPGYGDINFTDMVVPAILLAICEWFFHKYMARKILPDKDKT